MRFRSKKSLLIGSLSLAFLVCGAWFSAPSLETVQRNALGSDRVLLGNNGEVVQTLRTDFTKRRLAWQPLESFPQSIRDAVIEAEDHRFNQHFGLDIIGLARAAERNIRGQTGRVQGASTITMQVTDLIQPGVLLRNQSIRKGSIRHKFVQAWRALALELKWTKPQILEAYLNLIHLRGEMQGIPAASRAFLNKDPLALDMPESLILATMISSPNQGQTVLAERACRLQQRIENSATIDCERIKAAAASFFQRSPTLPTQLGTAPHLARRLFQLNKNDSIIHSTIDPRLQADVAAILEKNIQNLLSENVHDSAAIVIENKTGRVLAYVGAISSSQSPHVDGVQSYRQAGSSLKPFFYAKGIDLKLLTSASILLDEPTAISWGNDVYRPTNYDKHFYGPVSLREALGSSLNVPAVKTVTIIGLHQTYQVLQSLQFSQLKNPDFYGVSMALGAVEVRLDELANAYRIFANGGMWNPLSFLDTESVTKPVKVFSPEASFIISSILSDANARSIGFGWDSPLETSFWTAVKTGTSKDYRDNWCVGFSREYTVGVWAGNFDAQAMRKVSGVSGAGPSWYDIMNRLHANTQSRPSEIPAGVVAKKIRHQWASQEHTEYFIRGTEPVGTVIEPVLEKRAQFVFPAEGSVLVRDPHIDQSRIALFVRFKGTIPEKSQLSLDDKPLGEAVSPFKITDFNIGKHELAIISPDGKKIAKVLFTVKGAQIE